jgi:hypothetical protein
VGFVFAVRVHHDHRQWQDFLGYYKALGINLEEASECDECAAAARSVVAAGCCHGDAIQRGVHLGAAVCVQRGLGVPIDAAITEDGVTC